MSCSKRFISIYLLTIATSKDQYNRPYLVISKAVRKCIKINFLVQFKNKCSTCAIYRLLPYLSINIIDPLTFQGIPPTLLQGNQLNLEDINQFDIRVIILIPQNSEPYN